MYIQPPIPRSGESIADSETRKMELCLIFALYARALAQKRIFFGENPSHRNNKTLRPIILLERKVQDGRRPPAVVLGERAPLPDRRRHRGEDLRRHGPVERNQRDDLALFELPLITPRVVLVS